MFRLLGMTKNSLDICYEVIDTLKKKSIEKSPEFWEGYLIGYLGGILKSVSNVPEVREHLEKTLETLKKD